VVTILAERQGCDVSVIPIEVASATFYWDYMQYQYDNTTKIIIAIVNLIHDIYLYIQL